MGEEVLHGEVGDAVQEDNEHEKGVDTVEAGHGRHGVDEAAVCNDVGWDNDTPAHGRSHVECWTQVQHGHSDVWDDGGSHGLDGAGNAGDVVDVVEELLGGVSESRPLSTPAFRSVQLFA